MAGVEHSILAPSSACRRVQCAGSRALEASTPQIETEESREGVAAHWAFTEVFAGRAVALGQIAPNDVILTEEMVDGAEGFVDMIRSLNLQAINVEKRVDIQRIHPDCWGTPDVYGHSAPPPGYLWNIHVTDYKFGHRHVDAFENWQLLEYTAGILDEYGVDGAHDHLCLVNLHIYQPRNYRGSGPHTVWTTTAAELRACFNILTAAEYASMQPDALCVTGPECRDCKASHRCKALNNATLGCMDTAESNTPVDLTPQEAAADLRRLQYAADLLKAKISGREAEVLSALQSGARVPHFAVGYTSPRETWNLPAESVALLLGPSVLKPPEVITPAQARKIIVDELVNPFAYRPRGSAKLVPDDSLKLKRIFK